MWKKITASGRAGSGIINSSLTHVGKTVPIAIGGKGE